MRRTRNVSSVIFLREFPYHDNFKTNDGSVELISSILGRFASSSDLGASLFRSNSSTRTATILYKWMPKVEPREYHRNASKAQCFICHIFKIAQATILIILTDFFFREIFIRIPVRIDSGFKIARLLDCSSLTGKSLLEIQNVSRLIVRSIYHWIFKFQFGPSYTLQLARPAVSHNRIRFFSPSSEAKPKLSSKPIVYQSRTNRHCSTIHHGQERQQHQHDCGSVHLQPHSVRSQRFLHGSQEKRLEIGRARQSQPSPSRSPSLLLYGQRQRQRKIPRCLMNV